jgi:hypothetical protein
MKDPADFGGPVMEMGMAGIPALMGITFSRT